LKTLGFEESDMSSVHWKWPVHVNDWKPGRDYKLPVADGNRPDRWSGVHLRIAFVVTPQDVFPVQQCVNFRRETQHTVRADQWLLNPDWLALWEYTPVNEQLNSYINCPKLVDWFPVRGTPLGRFIRPTMIPTELALVFALPCKGRDNQALFLQEYVMEMHHPAKFMVIFCRDEPTEKWWIVYSGGRLHKPDGIAAALPAHAKHGCMCLGKTDPSVRKVVTLFAPKWMVYDRYGTLLDAKTCALCATSANRSARLRRPCRQFAHRWPCAWYSVER
jgi:hypothetical protein